MLRNAFGEPKPATTGELAEAMDEIGLDGADACAEVRDSRGDVPPYRGWTAEVRHADEGEPWFETCGFADKSNLIEGLKALGIPHIVTED